MEIMNNRSVILERSKDELEGNVRLNYLFVLMGESLMYLVDDGRELLQNQSRDNQ